MCKILWIGDVHIADNPPGKRTVSYRDDIVRKLEECVRISIEQDVTHVIFAGDMFHIKAASRISHRLTRLLADILVSFPVPVYILVGNHDITDHSLDSLQKQPLGILGMLPNVTLLEWGSVSLTDDVTLYPIPGVSNVTLSDYNISKQSKIGIMLAHQSIVPDINTENEMIRDILVDSAEIAAGTDMDYVLYGHQHRKDGVYTRESSTGTPVTFVNLGSICRLTISDDDMFKEPEVFILDLSGESPVETRITLNSVKPHSEVYDLTAHNIKLEAKDSVDETIAKLKSTELVEFSVDGVISELETRKDVSDEAKRVALHLLELVR